MRPSSSAANANATNPNDGNKTTKTKSKSNKSKSNNKTTAGGTTRTKSPRWSQMEKLAVLRVIRAFLPIGSAEWQKVVEEHAILWGHCGRDEDSIKRIFANLHKTKKPTGDPSCPPEVKAAKQAKRLMSERADLGSGGSDDDLNGLPSDVDDIEESKPPAVVPAAVVGPTSLIPAAVAAAPTALVPVVGTGTSAEVEVLLNPPFLAGKTPLPRQLGQGFGSNKKKRKVADDSPSELATGAVGMDSASFMSMMQMQMMQQMQQQAADQRVADLDRRSREEERAIREAERAEERRLRDAERAEERRLRAEERADAREQNQMMMMMMMGRAFSPQKPDHRRAGRRLEVDDDAEPPSSKNNEA
jgi:hypothetical protein